MLVSKKTFAHCIMMLVRVH